jgi:peptidoglycan biosynthesis protein MviN/MurJ (putative lipid II flippase)
LLLTVSLGWLLALELELGVEGLALALSGSTGVQFLAYVLILHRTIGARVGMVRLLSPLGRMAIAAVPAAATAWAICLLGDFEAGSGMRNIVVLLCACGAAVPIYLGAAWTLGVRRELRAVLNKIRRR